MEGEDMKQLSTITIVLLLLSYATGYAGGGDDDGPYKTTFSHYKKPGQPKTPVRPSPKVNYVAKATMRVLRGKR
jgi:hypothetical protein